MRNKMSKTVEQVVVGSILGDGHISKENAYYETHCLEQEDYLLWKKKVFDSLVFNKKFKKTNMRYNQKKNRCDLYIPRQSIFEEYREISYPNGEKIVSNKFIKKIGKLAICVWYFDDGCYNPITNGVQLCSYGFSYNENLKLQKILKNKFNLNFKIFHRHKQDQYYLACYGKDADKFLAFIKKNASYIPKSLTYKMGKFHKGNLKLIKRKTKFKKDGDKAYYQKNSKRIKKQCNEYYWGNRDKMRKIQSIYYQNNKDKWVEYGRRKKFGENKMGRLNGKGCGL